MQVAHADKSKHAFRVPQVNNGTYKSGFATSQAAYDRAQRELYAALDELEARLGRHRFLLGDRRAQAVREAADFTCKLAPERVSRLQCGFMCSCALSSACMILSSPNSLKRLHKDSMQAATAAGRALWLLACSAASRALVPA